MKKEQTRAVALVLMTAFLMSIASCGKEDYSEKILTCAGYISEYACQRKYVEIAAMSTGTDADLRSFMAMSTDSATIFRPQLAIESTLEYKVLEDTLECYSSDMTGTIDVEFTYCDYEEVLSDYPIFLTLDQFEEAVYECEDKIEVTLTYEFQYIDGLVKLTNISDLNELFPYRDIEVPLSLGYAAYVDSPVFIGTEYDWDQCAYRDTDAIICNVPITGDGDKLVWDYYYEIKSGFDVVYRSEELHEEYPEYLYINYDAGESIPGGFYDITLYDLEGEQFYTFTVYVIGNVDPIRYLADTSLYYELPEGYGYCDPNLFDMEAAFGSRQNLVEAYVRSNHDVSYGYYLVIERNSRPCSQETVDEYMANGVHEETYEYWMQFEDVNPQLHPINYNFTIDGVSYPAATYYIETDEGYYDLYDFYCAFNYEGETFIVMCTTDDYDVLVTLTSGLHFGG